MTEASDSNEVYRRTQSQIYGLQETILNSSRTSRVTKNKDKNGGNVLFSLLTTNQAAMVDSTPVLEYVHSKFGEPSIVIESFQYHAFKGSHKGRELMPFPFNLYELAMPPPFLPGYNPDMINRLVEIKIRYEDLQSSVHIKDSPRTSNNEIWGIDLYTDDSDPILILRHCGFSLDDANGTHRTPANLHNPDNILGTVPPEGTPFDVEVQLLLLPTLQKYASLRRNGITSRQWGSEKTTPHDGLSCGIYCIKIIPRDKSTSNVSGKDQEVDIAYWA